MSVAHTGQPGTQEAQRPRDTVTGPVGCLVWTQVCPGHAEAAGGFIPAVSVWVSDAWAQRADPCSPVPAGEEGLSGCTQCQAICGPPEVGSQGTF